MNPLLNVAIRERPARLSNANCCHSDDDIAAIDRKPVEQLDGQDFEIIFAISGCTARYDEQLYYLPLAIEYMRGNPDESDELVANMVYFVATNCDALSGNGLIEQLRNTVWTIFREWTRNFEVAHFDQAACRAKGSRVDHSDDVENSESVRALIDALLRYLPDNKFAEELVESWVRPDHTSILPGCSNTQEKSAGHTCTTPSTTPAKTAKTLRQSTHAFTNLWRTNCFSNGNWNAFAPASSRTKSRRRTGRIWPRVSD